MLNEKEDKMQAALNKLGLGHLQVTRIFLPSMPTENPNCACDRCSKSHGPHPYILTGPCLCKMCQEELNG